MNKVYITLLAVVLLGCADVNGGLKSLNKTLVGANQFLANANYALAGININTLSGAIIDYERLHPLTQNLCIPLEGFNYATGKAIFSKESFNFDETENRWNKLVEHGLFSKYSDKHNVIYKMTAIGKSKFSDVPCSERIDPYPTKVKNGLLYGKVGFYRFIQLKQNQFNKNFYNASYQRHFVKLDEWAKDAELRRRWRLQGITEIEAMKWDVNLVKDSTGVNLQGPPHSYD
ncbi:hypothetical protein EV683_12629 [Crenobacter luteus]|uniref:hypothetical protein n=1 Tax=Crenobacter luteus TaxID=1452487 RepID=UPI0010474B38|nr:hypothetical protein [Crenobacter luteus]TCP10269.1 hypothetical protein EV683_12629 [Crenobacter luteus]